MKAVVIEQPNRISLQEVETPFPEPGFVRIKVKAAALCHRPGGVGRKYTRKVSSDART